MPDTSKILNDSRARKGGLFAGLEPAPTGPELPVSDVEPDTGIRVVDNTLEPGPWEADTGRGLDPAGLVVWHGQTALNYLATALCRTEAFWDQVGQVKIGGDPLKVARRYGSGRRRKVIAHLMSVAAREPNRKLARRGLVRVGTTAWVVDDDPPRRRGPYALRPDFHALLVEGATLAVRRGVGECLRCGEPLSATTYLKGVGESRRRARRDYCPEHDRGRNSDEHRLRGFWKHIYAAESRGLASQATRE